MGEAPSTEERSSQRYATARLVIDLLERVGAPPTALNFELWQLCAVDPGCAFGVEVRRLSAEGAAFTEAVGKPHETVG